MWFCPLDGTLLQVRHDDMSDTSGSNGYFFCSTCPYSSPITAMVTKKTFPSRKVVDDILGGAAAWENVDRTTTPCPACNHNKAYFMQIQIRSADERECPRVLCYIILMYISDRIDRHLITFLLLFPLIYLCAN